MEEIVIFLYFILLAAAIMDFQRGKIPNRLVLVGYGVGMIGYPLSEASWMLSVAVLLFLFPFFTIGALGAGDVKCIGMIALYLTVNEFLISILCGFFIAVLFFIAIFIKDFFFHPFKPFQRKHTIRLAVPVFLGVLIVTGGTYL